MKDIDFTITNESGNVLAETTYYSWLSSAEIVNNVGNDRRVRTSSKRSKLFIVRKKKDTGSCGRLNGCPGSTTALYQAKKGDFFKESIFWS